MKSLSSGDSGRLIWYLSHSGHVNKVGTLCYFSFVASDIFDVSADTGCPVKISFVRMLREGEAQKRCFTALRDLQLSHQLVEQEKKLVVIK